MITIIFLIAINIAGCLNQEQIEEKQTEEEPYATYIITTYNEGKEIEKFEVYSNMEVDGNRHAIKVYDSQNEQIILFYSTLDYTIEKYKSE